MFTQKSLPHVYIVLVFGKFYHDLKQYLKMPLRCAPYCATMPNHSAQFIVPTGKCLKCLTHKKYAACNN